MKTITLLPLSVCLSGAYAALVQSPSGYLQPSKDKSRCVAVGGRRLGRRVHVRKCESVEDDGLQTWSYTENRIKLVESQKCLIVDFEGKFRVGDCEEEGSDFSTDKFGDLHANSHGFEHKCVTVSKNKLRLRNCNHRLDFSGLQPTGAIKVQDDKSRCLVPGRNNRAVVKDCSSQSPAELKWTFEQQRIWLVSSGFTKCLARMADRKSLMVTDKCYNKLSMFERDRFGNLGLKDSESCLSIHGDKIKVTDCYETLGTVRCFCPNGLPGHSCSEEKLKKCRACDHGYRLANSRSECVKIEKRSANLTDSGTMAESDYEYEIELLPISTATLDSILEEGGSLNLENVEEIGFEPEPAILADGMQRSMRMMRAFGGLDPRSRAVEIEEPSNCPRPEFEKSNYIECSDQFYNHYWDGSQYLPNPCSSPYFWPVADGSCLNTKDEKFVAVQNKYDWDKQEKTQQMAYSVSAVDVLGVPCGFKFRKIVDIDDSSSIPLKEIEISGTQVRSLPANIFENLPDLNWIRLNNNLLDSLSKDVFRNYDQSQLQHLNLAGNYLSNSVLTANFFQGLGELKYLYLDENRLTYIDPVWLRGKPQLQYFYINHQMESEKIDCIDETVFNNLPKLDAVSLSDLGIKEIPDRLFEGTDKLKYLYLERVPVERMSNRAVSHFRYLGMVYFDNPVCTPKGCDYTGTTVDGGGIAKSCSCEIDSKLFDTK